MKTEKLDLNLEIHKEQLKRIYVSDGPFKGVFERITGADSSKNSGEWIHCEGYLPPFIPEIRKWK